MPAGPMTNDICGNESQASLRGAGTLRCLPNDKSLGYFRVVPSGQAHPTHNLKPQISSSSLPEITSHLNWNHDENKQINCHHEIRAKGPGPKIRLQPSSHDHPNPKPGEKQPRQNHESQRAIPRNLSVFRRRQKVDAFHERASAPNAQTQSDGTKTLRPRHRNWQRHPVLAAAI